MPLFLEAGKKKFSITPTINRLEALGKALLEDGTGYGIRFGYNFDEHKAVELGYDYLKDFSLYNTNGSANALPINGYKLMANFLYNFKDERGFIPYMLLGLGIEKYDRLEGGLKNGAIAGIGIGAHFFVSDPVALRFEVRDIVRFADIGHTFSWTFGLEYTFGKRIRYHNEDSYSFPPYDAPKKKEIPAKSYYASSDSSARIAASKKMVQMKYLRKNRYKVAESKKTAFTRDRIAKRSSASYRSVRTERSEVSNTGAEPTRKDIAVAKVSKSENGVANVTKAAPVITAATASLKPAPLDATALLDDEALLEETSAGSEGDESLSMATSGATFATSAQKSDLRSGSVSDSLTESKRKREALLDDCESDSDRDGVDDCRDLCKDTPHGWRVDSGGCATAITMLVNFKFDSSELDAGGKADIGRLASFMHRNTHVDVVIEGHTDSIGSSKYNLSLSNRRALAVKMALENLGVSSERIKTEVYGEERPIASNKTAAGRAKNRRADAIIIRVRSD